MEENALNPKRRFSVGVIIPNYNDLKYLPDCIRSVLDQSVPFDQIVFIDDASTDESLAYVRQEFADRPEAMVIASRQNNGTVMSINHALEHCTCDYVLFLSANDFISPNLVERFHATMKDEVGFWSALCQNVSDDGAEFTPRKTPVIAMGPRYFSADQTVELMRTYTNWAPGTTVLYHRGQVIDHGGLDAPLKGLADWLLAVIVGVKSGVFFVPEILGTVRLHANTYLGSTLQQEDKMQSIIRDYLQGALAGARSCNDQQVEMIIGKVACRVRINLLLGIIRSKKTNRLKLPFYYVRLAVALMELFFNIQFVRLTRAKYSTYMAIYNADDAPRN